MATAARGDLEAYLAPFGLSSFRRGQREVIETVLSGKDCLCVMPTGGGKSLCYQLPAIASSGLTLVVSPLIALMKDQVDALVTRGLPASFINSTLVPDEQAARLEQMAAGAYKLMYVVPERFRSSRFLEAARRSDLKLLAIDEAHCVSEWGHDFRPDYARLGRFRAELGNPPTIALTATATDLVRRDIVELLNLHEPRVFITGFERPNLFYAVQSCPTDRDKDEALFRFLEANPGSGIVYASTRKRCEDVAERIAGRTRRKVSVYHAGLTPQERRAAQEDFMQGRTEIAVATLAFGMGIDKADVRFVVHYNLPGSLEAYYQEAGRAGRDGLPAQCLLLFGGGDRNIHEFFIESAYPSRDVVRQIYQFLCELEQNPIEMTQQEIKEELALQIAAEGVGACEKLLESAGVVERLETADNAAAVRLSSDLPTLVDLLPPTASAKRKLIRSIEQIVGSRRYEWCYFQPREILKKLPDFDSTALSRHLRELASLNSFDYVPPFRGRAIHVRDRAKRFDQLEIDFETLERQKQAEYERLERVLKFVRETRCRQRQILEYFGQKEAQACGHCDNCQNSLRAGEQPPRELDAKTLDAVRIVLSGVARITRTRTGVGKQLLAQMLCGKANKSVVRNRLDKLSTFGLLEHLKQTEVVMLIEALLLAGLLEQSEIEPFRPIIQLTPRGTEVMVGQGGESLNLPLPDELRLKIAGPGGTQQSSSDVQPGDQTPTDTLLLDRLRKWRSEMSRSLSIKPYLVISNAVLEQLARAQPTTMDALLAVKGIGPAKISQYGQELLAVLSSGGSEAPSAPGVALDVPRERAVDQAAPRIDAPQVEPLDDDPQPSQRDVDAAASRPSHYWTWRLLAGGFTPDECAAIRSLSSEVVLDHALRAADSGWKVEPGWFLSPQMVERVSAVLGNGQTTRIRDLLPLLPRGTRYEEVQLVLKARKPPSDSP